MTALLISAVISVLIASITGLIRICLTLRRNQEICTYRTELLERVYRAAQDDIAHGRDFSWRYEAYGEVTYGAMLHQYRRPLDSFYTDLSFATVGETRR